MKKFNMIQFIASLCLLIGCIINLVGTFISIPTGLSVCTVPLFVAALVLYLIAWVKLIKIKKEDKEK